MKTEQQLWHALDFDERILGFWFTELPHGNLITILSRMLGGSHYILQSKYKVREESLSPLKRALKIKPFEECKMLVFQAPNALNAVDRIHVAWETYSKSPPESRGWEIIRGDRSLEEFIAELSRMPGIKLRKEK